MSKNGIGNRFVQPHVGVLALGLAFVLGLGPAIAADAHSSPEDRARFVAITRNLAEDPLQPTARADRAWALRWLTEAPDVSVKVCLTTLGGMDEKYTYGGEVFLQYTFSMAALIIEHPETKNDPNAQQLAGVVGALKAYRSIIKTKPDAKSSALDSLLDTESRGELPDLIQKDSANCTAKK